MVKISFLLKDNEITSYLKNEEGIKPIKIENNEPVYQLSMEKEGFPIATGSIIKIDPETYKIANLIVNKRLRNKQIGTYALKSMLTKIKTLGGRIVILESPISLLPFFRKLGFKNEDGEIRNNKMLLKKELKFSKRPINRY